MSSTDIPSITPNNPAQMKVPHFNVPQITAAPPAINGGIPQINVPSQISPPPQVQANAPPPFSIGENSANNSNPILGQMSHSFSNPNILPSTLNVQAPSAEISISNFPKHTQIQPQKSVHYAADNNTPLRDFLNSADITPNTEVIVDAADLTDSISITKQILLTSQNGTTIVSNGRDNTIFVKTSLTHIKGFTFKQNESQASGSLLVESGDIFFENCHFISVLMPAVIIKGNSQVHFVNCSFQCDNSICLIANQGCFVSFSQCRFENSQSGLSFRKDSRALIANSTFTNINRAALSILNQAFVVCDNTTFANCQSNCIECKSDAQNVSAARTCQFKDCASGVKVSNSRFVLVSSTFENIADHSLDIRGKSAVTTRQNSFVLNNGSNPSNTSILSSILLSGESLICSTKDKFTGKSQSVFSASGAVLFEFIGSEFSSVDGICIVAANGAKGTITQSSFSDVSSKCAVVCSGSSIAVTDTTLQKLQDVAFCLKDCEKSSFSKLNFVGNEKPAFLVEDNPDNAVTIDDCTFRDNKDSCITSSNAKVNVQNSSFANNTSAPSIDLRKTKAQVLRVKFSGNDTNVSLTESQSKVESCEMQKNKNCILVSGGSCEITKTTFMENTGYCLFLNEQCSAVCNFLTIGNNTNDVAVAIAGKGTKCGFSDTTFIQNKVSLCVADGAECATQKCKFTGSEQQVDVANSASFDAFSVEFNSCAGKAAIHVHDQAKAKLDKCSVVSCAEVGVINTAFFTLIHSSMAKCGKIGIFQKGRALAEVRESVLQANGDCAVYAEAGKLTCIGNKIIGHKTVGLKIGFDTGSDISGNDMSNNGIMNVERE